MPCASVSVLEWNPSSAPERTVLLLHGGGVDSASLSWGGIGPLLAEAGFRVIAPDHPGYGHSPNPTWQATQRRLVDYVGELVDALELRRYVVGGLSLGGGMALGHVLERPERVSGAALFGSYGIMHRLSVDRLSGIRQFVTWVMLRTGLLRAATRWFSGSRAGMRWSLASLIRDPDARTPALVDEVIAAAAQGRGLDMFDQWQHEQIRWCGMATDYTPQLASFPRPALVVHGDRDAGVPVAAAEAAAAAMPDARLVVVPGAGHWVQRDRPDVVLATMVGFLRSLPA
nr:alpha/beta hydrolase [Mycolicibacterium hippocampi]